MNFGLSKKELNLIIEKIRNRINIKKAVIFGSRAMGNYKNGSDIDIVLFGADINDELRIVKRELNEYTNLPYHFDILNYYEIENIELKKHIDKYGKVIFER